jgi:hypothetical protein
VFFNEAAFGLKSNETQLLNRIHALIVKFGIEARAVLPNSHATKQLRQLFPRNLRDPFNPIN